MKLTKQHGFVFTALVAVPCLVCGYYLGIQKEEALVRNYFEKTDVINKRESPYDFTSPSVGSDSLPITSIGLYTEGYDKIQSIIDNHLKDGSLSDISLYYRDLRSSTWFGIKEDESFVPASLLKLIFALAAYKQEEEHPGFLATKVQFTQDIYNVAAKRGTVDTRLVLGKFYSIEDLLEDMMINSDNSARDLLATEIDDHYIDELYYLVGIHTPEARKEYKISAKDYSLFLRILYNTKFINEEHSDTLLALMAKSVFTGGLVGGVDSNIVVSHKFGVFTFKDATESGQVAQEIHDCGIVYYPDEPYLLCIMTKGNSQDTLASIIREISKSVYESHKTEDL